MCVYGKGIDLFALGMWGKRDHTKDMQHREVQLNEENWASTSSPTGNVYSSIGTCPYNVKWITSLATLATNRPDL